MVPGRGKKRRKGRPRKSWSGGRAIHWVLAVCLATTLPPASRLRAQSAGTSEYDVKAAFLFHFAQFVEWPAETFKNANAPLTFCTMGEDPFRGRLDESVRGKFVGKRALLVLHLKDREQIGNCQVLFLSATEKKRQAEYLASASGHAVLTVGETDNFTQQGGIIGFFLENNKVRFEINVETAEKARLEISSRLLLLAKNVLGSHA
jgi:YfiR/HmsC-like